MKKLILLSTLVALATSMYAQTVALHSSTGHSFFKGTSALVSAYAAASDGDTIYLSGGSFTAPSNFEKGLIIIGAGHYVDSTLATGKTFINGNVQLRENADNFYLEGVEVSGQIILYSSESINGVTIKRCKINGQFNVLGNLTNPSTNLMIIGNVLLQRINLQNAQTVIMANNLISNTFEQSYGNLISNNVIMGFIWGSSYDCLFKGDNNTFQNNIVLYTGYSAQAVGTGNIFNKNIYVVATPNYGTNGTDLGNYTGIPQADIFVDQSGTVFDYAHNYHLQAPTTYIGSDGETEVGLYGGTFPYKEGAVPLNPHIQLKDIAPISDAEGNLQIQIQVEAQND